MLKVIKPAPYNHSVLIASNAVEAYANYNAATTYAKGARVVYADDIWESLVNTNTGNQPDISPTFWVEVGPSNTRALFDGQISTPTISTTPLIVTIAPGIVNSLAFLGLVGSNLLVTATDGPTGPSIFNRSFNLDGTIIIDWYMYFFEPFVQLDSVVITDFPPYSNAHITMTLSRTTGTVEVGEWQYGTYYELGTVEYGATAGIIDYSKKDTDAFGVTTFVRRAFSNRMSVNMFLPNSQLTKVKSVLASLRATPCVWISVEDQTYSLLTVYGFYKDFTINVAYPDQSYCSLEVEGLT